LLCVGINAISHVPPLSLASSKLPLSLLIPFPSSFDVRQCNKDVVGCRAVPLTPPSLALLFVKFVFDGDSKGIAIEEKSIDGLMLFAIFHPPTAPPPTPPPAKAALLLHCALGGRQDGHLLLHLLLADELMGTMQNG
jgi:hypothetical protein